MTLHLPILLRFIRVSMSLDFPDFVHFSSAKGVSCGYYLTFHFFSIYFSLSVFDLSGSSGGGGLRLRMAPSLVTVKFSLRGRIRPPQKGKNPNSLLNPYKLMCSILSLLLTWYNTSFKLVTGI